MVNAERDDLDPSRIGAVQLHELVDLDRARGQEGVRAADDLRLGPRAAARLGALHLFRARLGLHAVEGVERRDERQAEAVLYRMPGETRKPVVGMNCLRPPGLAVDTEPGGVGHLLDDRLGELRHVVLQSLFGDRARRASGDVVDGETRFDRRRRRAELRGPAPCVDVADDAPAGERRGELTNIDVHAATVPGPRLGQGGGVHGEDGQPAHRGPAY